MTVDTKEVVTTIAYMIGVRMSALTVSYGECSELIEKLQADKDATTIRYLCKLRTVLMQKFKKTDDLMRYQLKNLHNIEWYDKDNIKQLEKWGFTIIQANCRSEKPAYGSWVRVPDGAPNSRDGQIYFCSLRFFYICCRSALYGPLVKRLRLRPLTPASGVRFSHGSPIFPLACVRSLCKLLKSLLFFCSMWTISSVG